MVYLDELKKPVKLNQLFAERILLYFHKHVYLNEINPH